MTSEEGTNVNLRYFLGTATGALATLTLIGAIGALYYSDRYLFLIPLVGYLVSRARTETPAVIVLQGKPEEEPE